MRRLMLPGTVVFWLVAVWPALAGPEIPEAALNDKAKLLGPKKAAYLMRQLDLTEQQAAHAQGLIDSILPGDEQVPINVNEVRQIWKAIEQAKAADDQAKVDELTLQLQQMGKEATGDAEFYDNIAAQLTDEQKQKLAAAQARLERDPSGALRPIDLLRAAWELNPTTEQTTRLRAVQEEMRRMLYPILRPNLELKLKLINFIHDETRAVLTPEQRAKWDLRVRALRPDLIDQGLRVKLPEPAQTNPPADE
jgi:Spy/CpxP family protein refolding chaperone